MRPTLRMACVVALACVGETAPAPARELAASSGGAPAQTATIGSTPARDPATGSTLVRQPATGSALAQQPATGSAPAQDAESGSAAQDAESGSAPAQAPSGSAQDAANGSAPVQDGAPSPADATPSTRNRGSERDRTPVRNSVDRVVDAVVAAHMQPCDVAQQKGVPCFPVSVEQEGPRFSVAEALRRYRADGRPAPGVPTVSEIQGQMSGAPQSASGGVGFDPVCTAKNLVKKLSGRNTTFHLYRMWDERGERPLLTDRKLDATAYAANPAVQYEYLGEFDGECAAVAAWRQALRKATEPKPLPDDWDEIGDDEPPQ